jgi:hypothetical protein
VVADRFFGSATSRDVQTTPPSTTPALVGGPGSIQVDAMDGGDEVDRNLPLQTGLIQVPLGVANDSELLNKPAPIAEIAVSEDISEWVFVLNWWSIPNEFARDRLENSNIPSEPFWIVEISVIARTLAPSHPSDSIQW